MKGSRLALRGQDATNNLRRMCLLAPPPPPSDCVKALAALGNSKRWRIMQLLSSGKALTASQVAKAVGNDFDGVSKQLRALRGAGLLASRRGTDRRLVLYYIPEVFRPRAGILDYGFCQLRLPDR